MLDAAGAVLLVEVHDRLGVGGRVERVAARFEIAPQRLVVVDLTVEHDPDRAVLVPDRLAPGLEVDDAQTTHAEPDALGDVEPFAVGSAMRHDVAHRADLFGEDRTPAATDNARDAAHRRAAPQLPDRAAACAPPTSRWHQAESAARSSSPTSPSGRSSAA